MAQLGLPLPGHQQLGNDLPEDFVEQAVFSLLASALLLLGSGVTATSITLPEGSQTPTSYIQKESGKVVMTSALVLL